MFRIICLIIGYFLGCIQTAYLVGRITSNIDIREHGSGNAGTTNISRVVGKRAGLIVFICDILKTVIAYVICSLIFGGGGSLAPGESVLPGFYGGIGVVLGHNFPFYLKFKGGKGAASSIGLILCVDFTVAFIAYVCGILSITVTWYISVASLLITFLIPVLLYLFHYPPEVVCLGVVIMSLCFFQHRENIKRLLNGTERKFSLRKKESK